VSGGFQLDYDLVDPGVVALGGVDLDPGSIHRTSQGYPNVMSIGGTLDRMRERMLSLLLRSTPLPVVIGVAGSLIAVETLLGYPLKEVAARESLGILYLLGVLVVSTLWGFWPGVVTAFVSAVAMAYFHLPPEGIMIGSRSERVTVVVFLAVALLGSSVAQLARSRAAEADERRGEAELAAELGRLLLRTHDLSAALPQASQCLAQRLGLPFAAIELTVARGDERRAALPLRYDTTSLGTLLVPATLAEPTMRRLRDRVVPPLQALLSAAREREIIADALQASRDEFHRLASEQSALRRVATLVAHGLPPPDVFAAVAEEAGRVLGADGTRLLRYEADGTATVLTSWGKAGVEIPVGTRVTLDGRDVGAQVWQCRRPARIEGPAAGLGDGVYSAVGAPILVEGHVWGVMKVLSTRDEPLPEDTEARFAGFTDLIATAIANTQARADLTASRARVVAAGDEVRRQIERDLHDGTQQRLVSLTLDLRTAAEASIATDLSELPAQLSTIASELAGVQDDLREITRGIHPAILSEGGLGPALKSLTRRSPLPVEPNVIIEGRLPETVEVAAYYVVAEALTNAAKHSHASGVHVEAALRDGRLHVSIHDDGIGGADPTHGSGLIGLTDRVEALGGTITVTSPPDQGTSVQVELPLDNGLPPAPPLAHYGE
jgi:signal transduction histidine kinase